MVDYLHSEMKYNQRKAHIIFPPPKNTPQTANQTPEKNEPPKKGILEKKGRIIILFTRNDGNMFTRALVLFTLCISSPMTPLFILLTAQASNPYQLYISQRRIGINYHLYFQSFVCQYSDIFSLSAFIPLSAV